MKTSPLIETLTDGFHFVQEDSISSHPGLVDPIPASQEIVLPAPNLNPELEISLPILLPVPSPILSPPVTPNPTIIFAPRRSQRIRK
jgi:hypothetical protein